MSRSRTHPFNLAIIIITPNHLAIAWSMTNTIWQSILIHIRISISIGGDMLIGSDCSFGYFLRRCFPVLGILITALEAESIGIEWSLV